VTIPENCLRPDDAARYFDGTVEARRALIVEGYQRDLEANVLNWHFCNLEDYAMTLWAFYLASDPKIVLGTFDLFYRFEYCVTQIDQSIKSAETKDIWTKFFELVFTLSAARNPKVQVRYSVLLLAAVSSFLNHFYQGSLQNINEQSRQCMIQLNHPFDPRNKSAEQMLQTLVQNIDEELIRLRAESHG
jgi:hypothetical protein